MISAPVGFQCPECVRAAPPVRTIHTLARWRPQVTIGIIALAVVAFLPSLAGGSNILDAGGSVEERLALFGPAVAEGEWWRLFTSGFVHYGLMHLGFNMAILHQLGTRIEHALGRFRFALVFVASLLGGSLGALVLDPLALTGGASGAVFGLMAASLVVLQTRGANLRQSGLPALLVVNLLITFVVPGISIGGHLGGLAGGGLAGALMMVGEIADTGRRTSSVELARVAVVLVFVATLFFACLAVASNPL